MVLKYFFVLWTMLAALSCASRYNRKYVSLSNTLCEMRPLDRHPNELELDCSKCKLTEVPDFSQLKNRRWVKKLNMSFNNITVVHTNSFQFFTRLRSLSLAGNRLTTASFVNNGTGMEKVRDLFLMENLFTQVPTSFLKDLKSLKKLNMKGNPIDVLRNDSFSGVEGLREVDIFESNDQNDDSEARRISVEVGAFRNMRSLKMLNLDSSTHRLDILKFPDLYGTNQLTQFSITGIKNLIISDNFCDTHRYLKSILMANCTMTVFPSLNKCTGLKEIEFVENDIGEITGTSFSGLPEIKTIEIFLHKNTVSKIHVNAFQNLPSLLELDLSHFPLSNFPNLKGTKKLEKLSLQFCAIKEIPADFCDEKPELINLDLNQNQITTLPSLSKCSKLAALNLHYNNIESLTNQFHGLVELNFLKLSENYLKRIPDSLFVTQKALKHLYLANNIISHIDDNAFENITSLLELDISNNKLRHLPHKGLQSVTDIVTTDNKDMIHFPTQQELPHAKRLQLDYSYHCCFFLKRVQQIHRSFESRGLSSSNWKVLHDKKYNHESYKMPNLNESSSGTLYNGNENIDPLIKLLQQMNNHTKLYLSKPTDDEAETMTSYLENDFNDDGYCLPTPNEFYPCEDLMGEEWLRVCVWIVFFLALLGNSTVLGVLFWSHSKLDVPRYLIMNLSFADLCLGIYLGFLAFVDIKTIGDFRQHALEWQFSGSCKFAGFLAVFSSELSVYTLTMITVERFLTIKNSMYTEKRMTRHQAFLVMGVGWIFSLVVAALPLFEGAVKFNDYTKYSVCLPFETDTLTSRIYLMFVLGINLFAFTIILFCYIKIYLFIRGSNAWNSGDSRAARRMAILVFTDFLCWFPIALVALSAVFKNPFISDLWISKVITIFIFPLNACANPFLYAIFTKQFRKDIAFANRHFKDRFTSQREIRKSLLRLPIKGSLTYSTSVRRGSSCSFLFGRRFSSRPDVEARAYSRNVPTITPSFQQSFEEPDDEDFQERLTTV